MPRLRAVTRVIAALIVCLFFADAPFCRAQPTPAGHEPPANGLIVGQVLDAGSNRAVGGAIVTLTGDALKLPAPAPGSVGQPSPGLRAMTTNDGRYFFRSLARGTYLIHVSKPGYLPGAFGARGPNGASQPIELDAGQRVADAVVTLWRYGTITGSVVDEAGEPVVAIPVRGFRRSTIAGRRRFVPTLPAITDDRGVYRIPQLTPGDYIVSIVSTQVAVPTSLMQATREEMETATGPMASRKMQLLFEVGAAVGQSGSAMTTEVGDLTLTIGRGAIPPPSGPERMFVYPTTFYPASLSASGAAVVTVGSGEERSAIDLQIAPVRCVRVSGMLAGPDGQAQNIPVRIVPAGANEFVLPIDAAATISDANGSFTFLAVPPGQYTLRALQVPRSRPTAPTTATTIQSGSGMVMSYVTSGAEFSAAPVPREPTLWADLPLAVGGNNLQDLVLTLRTGARVSGRVEFEGATPRPPADQLARIGVTLDSVDSMQMSSGSTLARVEADGQFRTYGVPAGGYVLSVVGSTPPGWTFKSATLDGRDVTDTPLTLSGSDVSGVVLAFTDRPTGLSGTVQDAAAGAGSAVIVFPNDPSTWTTYGRNLRRMRSTRTSRTGTYNFTGLPPGDYLVVAVAAESAPDWQDPKFLEGLAQLADSVRIQDGEKKTLDLRTK